MESINLTTVVTEDEYLTVVQRKITTSAGCAGDWTEPPFVARWSVGGPHGYRTHAEAVAQAAAWIERNPVEDGWEYGARLVKETTYAV